MSMRALAVLLAAALPLAALGHPDSVLQGFVQWFNDPEGGGGDAASLALADFPGMGTGVQATTPLDDGDTIISLPLTSVICRKTITTTGAKAHRTLFSGIDDDAVLVAAFLVKERGKGKASFWAPYIAALPESVPLPAGFTDDELKELQDETQAGLARRAARQLHAQFKSVSGRIVEALELEGVSDAAIAAMPLQDWFLWAMSLVDSRALTLRGAKYLVPFADMFNYQPQEASRSAASGAHFLKYHVLSDTHFTVKADRHTAAGDQVFEDYGDNPSTIYLQHHGFVPEDNPFDCVDVQLPDLRTGDPLINTKRRLLRNTPLSRTYQTCLRPGQAVNRRVYDWLHIVYMKAKGLQACNAVLKGSKDHKDVARCVGDVPNREAGNVHLVKALKRQLQAYSTTAKFDSNLLSSGDLSDAVALAVRFRLGRKRLLERLIQELGGTPGTPGTPTPSPPAAPAAAAAAADGDGDTTAKDDGGSLSGPLAAARRFNEWFDAQNPPVALIKATWAGAGMRMGVVATRDIDPEEPYLSVPETAIMSTATAFKCPDVGPVLQSLRKKFNGNGDAFHELLFHLMYEKFALPAQGKQSFFKPYLDYLPTAEEMLFPSFYSEQELQELQASVAQETARTYQQSIVSKFERLRRLLDEYSHVFLPEAFTLDNYRWAHAILDSRSIWWNNERHLVPMLDLVNCQEGPDPSRVHATRLDKSGKNAVTLAPWGFKEGQPVYENYGQPNHIYFSYHGFSLDDNTHDCVQVKLGVDPALPRSKREAREAALRKDGFRTPVYVACLDPSADDLNLESRDTRFVRVAYDTDRAGVVPTVHRVAEQQLQAYATTVEEDEALLERTDLTDRMRATVRFRLSEKRLLRQVARQADEARRAARGGEL